MAPHPPDWFRSRKFEVFLSRLQALAPTEEVGCDMLEHHDTIHQPCRTCHGTGTTTKPLAWTVEVDCPGNERGGYTCPLSGRRIHCDDCRRNTGRRTVAMPWTERLALMAALTPGGALVWLALMGGILLAVGWLSARVFPGQTSGNSGVGGLISGGPCGGDRVDSGGI